MGQLTLKKAMKPSVCCLFITLIAGYGMNVFVLGSILLGQSAGTLAVQVMNELSIVMALVILPYFIYKKALNYDIEYKFDKRKLCKDLILEIVIGIALILLFDKAAVIHFFIIAFAEEMHFRVFQYGYIESKIGTKEAIIISSIIFAFVLHLNDMFIGNLLIRLPLGIVLGLIRYKFGAEKSIYTHWIYDVIVSMI